MQWVLVIIEFHDNFSVMGREIYSTPFENFVEKINGFLRNRIGEYCLRGLLGALEAILSFHYFTLWRSSSIQMIGWIWSWLSTSPPSTTIWNMSACSKWLGENYYRSCFVNSVFQYKGVVDMTKKWFSSRYFKQIKSKTSNEDSCVKGRLLSC